MGNSGLDGASHLHCEGGAGDTCTLDSRFKAFGSVSLTNTYTTYRIVKTIPSLLLYRLRKQARQ